MTASNADPLPARRGWLLPLCLLLCLTLPLSAVPRLATAQDEAEDEILWLTQPWTGDLDGMVERQLIRVLVVPSKTDFFIDKARARGSTIDMIHELEKLLNKQLKTKALRVRVKPVPVQRDQLLPYLVAGRGDIAAANLTITEERLKTVDFSAPFWRDVKELIVTGPGAPELTRLEDLSGQQVYVLRSSSYHESLTALNARFADQGLDPVEIVEADERLEAEDILEMVNAGLVPITVVDDTKALFWADIFDDITVHRDLAVRSGGEIAAAIRKDSPQLKALLDGFAKTHGKGTLVGNIIFKRYLRDNKWVRNAADEGELDKFNRLIKLLRSYAGKYDFDWLMIGAQGYQESGLDQSKRSHRGAVGVMQVLPSTAADPNVAIADIEDVEQNIHAGVKYLNFLRNRYFSDPEIDSLNRALLSFAAYNAGPGNVRKMRARAEKLGLDPNVWFGNVEVAAARIIGRETVQYVSNIYKYYVAYRLLIETWEQRQAAREKMGVATSE